MKKFKSYPHRYHRKITRRSEQGQSFVEFALIVPVLFLLLLGVTVIAQGFNLQMVLYGAAYEGARVWAKNPVGGDDKRCSPPACNDPDSGSNNFETYVIPVVRQYIANNGFDGDKVQFFTQDQSKYQDTLEIYARQTESVSIILIYPYELPIEIFGGDFKKVRVVAGCTMKRGG